MDKINVSKNKPKNRKNGPYDHKDKVYVPIERKFHDSWAFILYVLLATSINVYSILNLKISKIFYKQFDMNIILLSFIYVLSFIFIVGISLMFFAETMMHIGFITSPMLILLISLYFREAYSTIICVSFSILSFFGYFFWYRKKIKYSACIVKEIAGIILNHSIFLLLTFVILSSIMSLQHSLAAFKVYYSFNQYDLIILPFYILYLYWTYFTLVYGMKVLVSSLVCFNILIENDNVNILYEALKNTCFSMGSVCLGGLLIGIVSTLKFLKDNTKSREDRNFAKIIFFILDFLFKLLETIIEFINEFTFPYLGLYGKSYLNSVKGGFEIISQGDNIILTNSLCVYPIIGMFGVVGSLGYIFILYMFNFFVADNITPIVPAVVLTNLTLMNVFIRLFESATIAFLFTNDYNASAVMKKYPIAAKAMREQIIKESNE